MMFGYVKVSRSAAICSDNYSCQSVITRVNMTELKHMHYCIYAASYTSLQVAFRAARLLLHILLQATQHTCVSTHHKKSESGVACVSRTLLCLKSEAQQQMLLKATVPTEQINMKAVGCLQAYK